MHNSMSTILWLFNKDFIGNYSGLSTAYSNFSLVAQKSSQQNNAYRHNLYCQLLKDERIY